ncbi:phage holin family protein [Burkholderia gladioli]|uniref:phage holin family protein n=1 Tax=Burkholderia gladioli TaxID=28095 RepID=UPI00202E6065|nr:phage holin family protein [Burkholderia gladioli]URV25011.1 phage holin family protein [Burkholderia gladioli]
MHLSYALVAFAAHLAVIVRVLAYRRDGARHRFHVAWAAWAIVAVSGGAGIELLLHARATGFFQAALAVLLAILVHLARGDIAHLLRSKQA